MKIRIPADQPRRPAAGAGFERAFDRGANARMMCEPEVIVRCEVREDALADANVCRVDRVDFDALSKLVRLAPLGQHCFERAIQILR